MQSYIAVEFQTTSLPARQQESVMAITLSPTAASEIKKIIKDQSLPETETRLRVGVKGGGCSGFSYMLDLTEEAVSETDEAMESNGVAIVCDSKSLIYLDGTEIDFKDEVMGRGFVFKNPNATSSCGCGSSFSA
ncbi:MAG: HesB/IscA family protein [Tepidisphaeraceae bacterium]